MNAKRAVLKYRLSRALAVVRMRRIAMLFDEKGQRQRIALEALRAQDWKVKK